MAIKEVEKEEFSWGPIILMGVLLLILVGIGFGIYAMISGPKTKTITLKGKDAENAVADTNNGPTPAGPAFPAVKELPQAPNPGATTVTMDLKNASAAQVLEELKKQTNAPIEIPQQGGGFLASLMQQRFDFSVKDQPFWAAVDELSKKTQMRLNSNPWDQRSQLQFQNGGENYTGYPTQDIGACRLVLTGVTSRMNADLLAARPNNRALTVSMMLYVEPKVNAYRLSPIATVETAVDESGHSLIRPRDPWDDRNGGNQRNKSVARVEAKLQFIQNAGNKIAKLKGYASVVTVGKDGTVTFKDPLKAVNVDQSVDGQPIRLRRLTKSGGGNNYDAELSGDGYSPLFRDWDSYSKMARLFDAAGKEYHSSGTGMGGSQKTVDLYLSFNGDAGIGPPAELRVTLPTQVKEIRVPFDFTDLPLPH
jgi:hypothetical protein